MNHDEAKSILLLYRNPADAEDPQIAEALALAKSDNELSRWLEEHCARQEMLRGKFHEIAVPDGLKEKILAAASPKVHRAEKFDWKIIFLKPQFGLAAAMVIALLVLSSLWFQQHRKAAIFSIFQNQMVGVALRGYNMDLATNNPNEIRSYLAKNGAPSDYALPPALEKMEVTGCAIEHWNGTPVSMICLRTGKPLSSGRQNDLWLFVVDRSAVKDFPSKDLAQFSEANGLATAFWTQDGKFYFLGTETDKETIRQWL